MARAHFSRPVLDSAGNVRLNAIVRVLEPNSSTPIAQAMYAADGGQEQIANPNTFGNGVIDFYLNEPQRVRIGIKFGSGAEFFYEDIDVLPVDHPHAADKIVFVPGGGTISSTNVQGALATLEAIFDQGGFLTVQDAQAIYLAITDAEANFAKFEDLEADYLKIEDAVESTVGAGIPVTTDRKVGDLHFDDVAEIDYRLVDVAGALTWVELGANGTANTTGVGLPVTTGRTAGDLHWDETTDAEALYVLTGDPLAWVDTGDKYLTQDEADALYLPVGASTGSLNTIGASLPALSGRKSGDGHFNLDNGRYHLLTGTAGETANEPFTHADGTLVGKQFVANGTTYTWALDGSENPLLVVANNKVSYPAAGGFVHYHVTSAGANTASLSLSMDFLKEGGVRGVIARGHYAGVLSGDTLHIVTNGAGWPFSGDIRATLNLTTVPGYSSLPAGTVLRVSLQVDGDQITATATSEDGSTVWGTLSYTDPTPFTSSAGLGQTVGFKIGAGTAQTLTGDNFSFTNLGTLKWVFTDPQFFQGIVPGAITVANHVLKPGIRIPAPTTVRQFVVRLDDLLSGGATTVVARRFNNGVDTGDSLTVTVPDGESVASTTGVVATAQGDVWKFDVTAAGGSPTDMLLALDAWG